MTYDYLAQGCSCKKVKVDKLSITKMRSELTARGSRIDLKSLKYRNIFTGHLIGLDVTIVNQLSKTGNYCTI